MSGNLQRYWLCCGSKDPMHRDERAKTCLEAKMGHSERCRYGTIEDHGDKKNASN